MFKFLTILTCSLTAVLIGYRVHEHFKPSTNPNIERCVALFTSTKDALSKNPKVQQMMQDEDMNIVEFIRNRCERFDRELGVKF